MGKAYGGKWDTGKGVREKHTARTFYSASSIPGWCYLCGEPHLYQYPCSQLAAYAKRKEANAKRRATRANGATNGKDKD